MHFCGPRPGSLPQVEIEESPLPNTPKTTASPVLAHESRGAAVTETGTVRDRYGRTFRERASAPCSTAVPTARSTDQAANAPQNLPAGSGTTTIEDDTQPAATNPPSPEPTRPFARHRLQLLAIMTRAASAGREQLRFRLLLGSLCLPLLLQRLLSWLLLHALLCVLVLGRHAVTSL